MRHMWKRFVTLSWQPAWFIRNIWRYRSWLARDADFDWEYLADVMEIKLRAMAEHFRGHGCVVGSDDIAAECLEAAECLNVMRENDIDYDCYLTLSYADKDQWHKDRRVKEDVTRARFGELMSKIEHWWD